MATLADLRVLVVPGLHDSGPDHWQTRWQGLHPHFERVEQDDWETPQLDLWAERLLQKLAQSSRPTLLIAHSFGCLTSVHASSYAAATRHVVGALLAAPADPDKFDVVNKVDRALPFPSLVIGSSDDPWMSAPRAAHWAQRWGSSFVNAGAVGHINAASGLGDWRDGQALLDQLLRQID